MNLAIHIIQVCSDIDLMSIIVLARLNR